MTVQNLNTTTQIEAATLSEAELFRQFLDMPAFDKFNRRDAFLGMAFQKGEVMGDALPELWINELAAAERPTKALDDLIGDLKRATDGLEKLQQELTTLNLLRINDQMKAEIARQAALLAAQQMHQARNHDYEGSAAVHKMHSRPGPSGVFDLDAFIAEKSAS